ncbi:MAG: outer membrane lipoprotein-sorting protein [Rhodobacteraceae bacterium]|nr:outer membrane lipoprotein-sorting protein [Paracoccaceae bacterium]
MPSLTRRHLMMISAAAVLLPSVAMAQDPGAILRAAFDNWRATSSHVIAEMTIRSSTGTRSLTMESWTEGSDKALVRFIAPARDAGNATLQSGRRTYVFNPRLNQVIQLPASAMSQSWMGSDFSYSDLTKTEQLVNDYTHTLLETRRQSGHVVYVIESVPKRGKPIVWGKQIVHVRADFVLLRQEFYDQSGNLVRTMVTDRVRTMGGRPYPTELTMSSVATPGQYTKIVTQSAAFDIDIPSYLFTRSNLQNPR